MHSITIQTIPGGIEHDFAVLYSSIGQANTAIGGIKQAFRIKDFKCLGIHQRAKIYWDHKDFLKTNGFLVFIGNSFCVCSSLYLLCFGDQLPVESILIPMIDGEIKISNLERLQNSLGSNPLSLNILKLFLLDQNKNPTDVFVSDEILASECFEAINRGSSNNELVESHCHWLLNLESRKKANQFFAEAYKDYFLSLSYYQSVLQQNRYCALDWVDLCNHITRSFVTYIQESDFYGVNLPLSFEFLDIVINDRLLEYPTLNYSNIVHRILIPQLNENLPLILYPS
ncbi:MAG: hypothetical protein ACRCXZ_03480 [Patescibacteria group bacterium]